MPLVEAYWVPFVWVVIQGMFACISGLARKNEEA
jgi:hypothetical protein